MIFDTLPEIDWDASSADEVLNAMETQGCCIARRTMPRGPLLRLGQLLWDWYRREAFDKNRIEEPQFQWSRLHGFGFDHLHYSEADVLNAVFPLFARSPIAMVFRELFKSPVLAVP